MKSVIAIAALCVLPATASHAWQAASVPGSGSGGSTLGYECTDDEEDGRYCVCVGLLDCMRMRESEVCTHTSGPLEGTHDIDCDDIFNACDCTWPREGQSPLRRTDRFGDNDRLSSDEARSNRRRQSAARFGQRNGGQPPVMTAPGRRNETVPARRGGSSAGTDNTVGSTNFDPVSPITDPIEDTLGPVGSEIADAMDSLEEGLGDLLGSSSDDEARPPVVDHREGRTPPRRNETVPSRRASLQAPSDLALAADTSTSLVIHWRDNATSEFGVHVERGTPERARGGVNYNWRRVFSSEERVTSRVSGTGPRSDIDDGLTQGTRYCYRLRAYRGETVSEYSDIECTILR